MTGVDPDHDALHAEAVRKTGDEVRVGERRRVDGDLVGAVARSLPASSTVRMPPATQNGMSIASATRLIQLLSTTRPSDEAVMS